jgi:hypothetical protein
MTVEPKKEVEPKEEQLPEGVIAPEVATEEDAKNVEAFDEGLEAEGLTPKEDEEEEEVKPEEGEGDPEAKEPEKEGAPEKEEEVDPIATEIEKLDLKKEAADRFRELSTRLPVEKTQEMEQQIERGQLFENAFTETFKDPKQFEETQAVIKAINSSDPAVKMQGRNAVTELLKNMDKELGVVTDENELLGKFPDLQSSVDLEDFEDGKLSREHALEIAKLRSANQLNTDFQEKNAQTMQAQVAENQAIQESDSLIEGLKAEFQKDPAYETKLEQLRPMLNLIGRLPVADRAQALAEAWVSIPEPKKVDVSGVPLRPIGSGVMSRAPKTPLEAFEFGVDSIQNP